MIKTSCPVIIKCECGKIIKRHYPVTYSGSVVYEIMECEGHDD